MKTELFKVVAADTAFKVLQKENKVPFTLAWEIDDLLEVFSKHVERFEKERTELIKEYGAPDKENPDMYILEKDSIEEYNKKITELGSTEIELDKFKKIKKNNLKDLEVPGTVNISAIKEFVE